MKKSEYTDIESSVEGINDETVKKVLRFVIKLLKEINPGDSD